MRQPASGAATPRSGDGGGAAVPLLLFLGGGALLRFAALDDLPPAHYRDVALTATDALRAAAGDPRLHTTYDEGLYSNLMALVFRAFGASDWSVRAPGALFGLLTCAGVLRLGRALGLERAGLWGAGLLAVSSWHVVLSRSGFRAVLLPCLLAFSLALLAESRRRGGAWRSLLGGALLGLGVHVYPAVRFAPLMFPAFLVVLWRRDPGGRPRLARAAAWYALAALLVAAPMIADYVRHPEHFTYPHRIVSIFSPGLEPGEGARRLPGNALWTLLMFHVRGDANPRHHFPGAPLLDPLAGGLLLAGLAVIRRTGRDPAAAGAPALLAGWLAAMLLPNLLSVEGVPHGLRSSGAIPAVFLLAGAGLAFIERRLAARVGARAVTAAAVAAILLAGVWTAERYFRRWGRDPAVVSAHDGALRAAARALRAAPPDATRFVVANGDGFPAYGHPVETQVFLFELRDDPPVVLGPKDAPRLVLDGRAAVVAFERRDDRALEILRRLNPGARVEEWRAPGVSSDHPVYRVD
jgi:hypothetical protein